jgi:hypothetical protein
MRAPCLPLVLLLLSLPGVLGAQSGPEPCGTTGDAESDLATFTGWLRRPFDLVRDNVEDTLPPIAPDATTEIMTDGEACARVLSAGVEKLRALGQMKAFRETGFQHRIYRLGPYYAISFSDAPPEDPMSPDAVIDLAPDFILFFDVASMAYLGEVFRG